MDGYSVELGFDKKAEAKLIKVGIAVAKAGLHAEFLNDANVPHLTLAALHSKSDPEKLSEVVSHFAKTVPPFHITFHSVAQFIASQNVVYLAPLMTADLFSMYQRCHTELTTAGLETGFYHRAKSWTPHTTITMKGPSQDVAETMQIVRKSPVFNIPMPITSIKVVWYAPFKLIDQFELKG
ncbi:MAG: 2'-5' RNA ligase [Cellvibrionaceae bacterium]|jgi:2'-5' RNA ligase